MKLLLVLLNLVSVALAEFACPESGIDFNGNDIAEFYDIANYEECGMSCNNFLDKLLYKAVIDTGLS